MPASWRPPDRGSGTEPGPSRQPIASGEPLNLVPGAGDVVGRSRELARIGELLAGAQAGRAGVLAIEGEAGIGKTRLLQAAAAEADGFLPLWARGVQSEATLGYAALLELLAPLRARLPDVPSGQAAALASALGWGAGDLTGDLSGDRFLVAGGTLSLLAAAADHGPLLVLVDDLQWIDEESAAAVLFAARRMRHDRVAFIVARRADSAAAALDGVDPLTLAGLTAPEAGRLLGADLAGGVVARLVAQVQGNPLALVEAAARLTPAQRRGAAPLPDPLPLGRHLEAAYQPLLASLSAGARQAVRLLAAANDEAALPVVSALRRGGFDADAALDDAEERGVVVRSGGALRFRHPLLRSAVWRLASPQQRRAAHRALADPAVTTDAISRTWHRAHAAAGPDDELADDLVAAAEHARRRRGFASSSRAFERAAELTTERTRAALRMADAVADAFVAGDLERTRALAEQVLQGDPDPSARGEVLHTLGILEQYAGSIPAAVDLLSEAADLTAGRRRVWSLSELANAQFRLDDFAAMDRTAARLAGLVDEADPEQRVLADFTLGISRILGGAWDDGRHLLQRAAAALEEEPVLRDDPRFLMHALMCAGTLGEGREAVPRLERRTRLARERGALGVLVTGLALSSYGRAVTGDHAGAFADAGEAAELAEQLSYVGDAAPAVEMVAVQSAFRGLHDDARSALARAVGFVRRAGTTEVAAHLALTSALCALCRGDLAEVSRLLEERLAADGGRGATGEPLGVAPLLVEAYVGLGRTAEAHALTVQYAAAVRSPLPATSALVARCRALAASDDEEAVRAFDEALAAHALAPDRYEAARTRLLYGSRLRRAGRRREAREQLRQARDAFAAWDLTHWVQQAEAELRATGETAKPRRPLPEEPLTSQETRIALLVAQGLSNREVAAALFLSPKTIEHHLSSVYRKRGLRSRTELARLYATAAGTGALSSGG